MKSYNIPIGYMLAYTVAILFSGVWIFLLSQGLASSDLATTVMKIGNAPLPKSLHGMVEVATPHIFAMGILIFVVVHFMLFSTRISKKFSLRISILLFATALLNILAYLLISFGLVVFGWVKLFTLVLFVLVFLWMLGLVAFSL